MRASRTLLLIGAALTLQASPGLAQVTAAETLRKNPALAIERTGPRLAAPEAELAFDSRGDIPDRGERKYLPPGKATAVALETNLGQDPRIRRLRWQVSRHPFYGPVDAPVGLVAEGLTSHRAFEIELAAFHHSAPAMRLDGPRLGAVRTTAVAAARLDPAVARSAARVDLRWSPPAPRYYVRVVPVDARPSLDPGRRPAVVGKPSRALELVIAEKPLPQTDLSSFEFVSQEDFDLRLVEFRYQPTVTTERWPAGCRDVPRDEGKDAVDVIGDAPGALVDLVDWASEAYADLKQMAVSLMGDLLPFVPESVISVALDSALAAAGLPPSIPNVDQLMTQGADYLATQAANQIPVPGSGALAEMAQDQAREEIRERTRQALLETARGMARRQRESVTWCTRHVADPYFLVTLRNASDAPARGARLVVSSSADLLEPAVAEIEYMAPGQRFTIPIAYRARKNVPVRWVSQLPDHDRQQALHDWWRRYNSTPVNFTVRVTETLRCRADGSCAGESRKLLQTPTRLWDEAPAYRVAR